MKKHEYIFSVTLALLGLSSCSVETPFQGEQNRGEGFLSKSAIDMNLNVDETIKATRAGLSDVNTDDFQVEIISLSGDSNKKFDYKDMPEIVTLTAGNYKIEVTYNDDLEAAWNNPHFKGVSNNFTVTANEITTDIETIICSLQNVMVSVVLDDDLLNNHVIGDPEIEVWVNNGTPLTFTNQHYGSSNPIPGYFRHSEVCTLTAQFKGVVDGVTVTETKTLNNVEAGNHYRITFYRHSYQGEDQGSVDPQIKVEAKVDVNNVATNVDMEEDKVLEDAIFPTESPAEGEGPGTTDPIEPDDPQPEGPTVKLGNSTVDFGENIITPETIVILDIHSDGVNGLEKFKILIESDDETLQDMGEIDLINPAEEMIEDLQGFLKLLPEDKATLSGETDVHFDISAFMGLLCNLGRQTHKFTILLGDSTGEKEVEFIFIVDQDWN